jgi:urea transporter
MVDFIVMLLKGFGQIFFQDNVLTGTLIALGIGIASPVALLLAIIGGGVSALVIKVLGYDSALYSAGLAAFNGILIGCAVAFYIKSLPTSVLATIIGAVVGGVTFHLLVKYNITPYALPFTLVVFLLAALVRSYAIH